MPDSTEKPQQPSSQSTPTEVRLFGEGEHTHGAPREKLTLEEIYRFAGKQEETSLFTDDHHLVQIWRPEDLKRSPLRKVRDTCSKLLGHPAAPPLAPGHYRLRFKCGDTQTTVDWPEEQTGAYFVKFAKDVGYYWKGGLQFTPMGTFYGDRQAKLARVGEGMRLADCYDITFVQYISA
ncbi:hypothetical protein BO82DRAFT_360533 [Aspergillus uvarum CBS 121591]|uniref:Uncharacterized protein n=1 Tax=Aspergillus uvarum CBS 121591 TaxID=1448315 RepID=A0A319DFI3_9EURO|nr:hypothetical protein BO82DRAFT_360533 [Aspergillus uvarum CBS 121591]PYH86808.1 hypothetical protein BO82DRAFT_360533 [Aspergillus uvarum CBS 121591]